MSKTRTIYEYCNRVVPVKLTEARNLKLHSKGWGIISDYILESIKINNRKNTVLSVATISIADFCGQTTCVIKGQSVCLLFGLTIEEWREVEDMCLPGQQLYYRYFKNGANLSCSHEQKLFYNFCATNQQSAEMLFGKFVKCVNYRNNSDESAVLEIFELRKCDTHILDVYTNQLQRNNNQ